MALDSQLSLPTKNKCDPPSFLVYLLDSLAPALLFLSILYVHTKTMTQMFTAALFLTSPNWKQSETPSSSESINQICYIHTMEYYSTSKRNELLATI